MQSIKQVFGQHNAARIVGLAMKLQEGFNQQKADCTCG